MQFVRIFLTVLVLIFSLQSWTKADDIRDLEIEGISIGDSLLLYSTEKEIKKDMLTDYNSKKYSRYTLRKINSKPLEKYDDIQVHFKTNDKNYIIQSISGGIYYVNQFDQCLQTKKEVIDDLTKLFPNARINDYNDTPSSWYEADPSGNTITSQYFFNFGSNRFVDYIEVACYDWGEEAAQKYNAADHLKLGINEKEFGRWLVEESFK